MFQGGICLNTENLTGTGKQAPENCDRGGGVIAEQILKMENDRAAPEAFLFQ